MQTLLLRKFMMSLVHEGPDFSAVWAADALHSPMRRGLKAADKRRARNHWTRFVRRTEAMWLKVVKP